MTEYSAADFWEDAPSGLVIAHPDGRIIRVNATAARWLGYEANALCGMMFTDLLTASGRILYETHFGPLLQVGGDLNGVTVDIVGVDGARKPMFLTANVKIDVAQKPELLRISVVDAADRRAYEVELLEARRLAVKGARTCPGVRRHSATSAAPTRALTAHRFGGRRVLLHGFGRRRWRRLL